MTHCLFVHAGPFLVRRTFVSPLQHLFVSISLLSRSFRSVMSIRKARGCGSKPPDTILFWQWRHVALCGTALSSLASKLPYKHNNRSSYRRKICTPSHTLLLHHFQIFCRLYQTFWFKTNLVTSLHATLRLKVLNLWKFFKYTFVEKMSIKHTKSSGVRLVSLQDGTRAPLGYSVDRAPLGGGGAYSAPPLPNSRTNRRCEAGEAAMESPEREGSNVHKKFL